MALTTSCNSVGCERLPDKRFLMTLCSRSLRLAGLSAATKIVLGVTGRQKVFDSSAIISSASSSETLFNSILMRREV